MCLHSLNALCLDYESVSEKRFLLSSFLKKVQSVVLAFLEVNNCFFSNRQDFAIPLEESHAVFFAYLSAEVSPIWLWGTCSKLECLEALCRALHDLNAHVCACKKNWKSPEWPETTEKNKHINNILRNKKHQLLSIPCEPKWLVNIALRHIALRYMAEIFSIFCLTVQFLCAKYGGYFFFSPS